MRRVLLALRRRIALKVFAAVGLVVVGALVAFAWQQTSDAIAQLKASTRTSAERLADVIVANIEMTMLQGNGILVKDQVRRVVAAVPDAEIEIYDPRGVEVFGERAPAPSAAMMPQALAATLADHTMRVDGTREWRPIENEQRCHECHEPEPALRGVLAVTQPRGALDRAKVVRELIEEAFIQIMTAKQDGELDGYFEELAKKTPSLRRIAVYNRDGEARFGVPISEVTNAMLAPKLVAGASVSELPTPGGKVHLVPLPMEDRCEQCHEPGAPIRGVLAVEVGDIPVAREIDTLIDTSLRFIMLSNLGRMIGAFLDRVVAENAASELVLYDNAGRMFYTSAPPPPAQHIASALATRAAAASFIGKGSSERVRVVQPLPNEAKCVRCHGAASALRGVVSVSLSTRAAAAARDTARRRAIVFIAIALCFVLFVLYTLLQRLVAAPVQKIGAVADRVGQGQLDVAVHPVKAEGDEVQRLGKRINEMITGLRTGSHLKRFVSRGTIAAAHGAATAETTHEKLVASRGVRRECTVLFTDIRGFTAHSETVTPEQVVEMLNRFLQVQADIVERHGGDIDKYVGDELMAVFDGDDAAVRAVRCGVEMVAAIERTRAPGESLAVGCGISLGEVVYGPIGSLRRMDFTVIGDVVNTGARLCSAAQGGEVLVSAAVRNACGAASDIDFTPLEPLQLKGKRQPFAVFRAGTVSTIVTSARGRD